MNRTAEAPRRPGRTLATTAAVTVVCVSPPFLLGAMAVQVRADLGFSESGVGLAVGAFFLVAAALSAVMGRWAERAGGSRSPGGGPVGRGRPGAGGRRSPLTGPAHAAGLVVGDPVVAFPAPVGPPGGRSPVPVMVVLAAGAGLGAAAAGTLGAFLVSAGVAAGLSEGAAGLTLTLGSGLGVASRLWAGALADRRSGGHLRRVAAMLMLGSCGYLLFAAGRPGLLLAGLPLAFGAGWAWPGLFNLAVVLANPAAPGAATGFTQTGTYVGAVLGPLVFGVVAEHLSFGWAWWSAALMSGSAAAAIWTGRWMLRRHRGSLGGPTPPDRLTGARVVPTWNHRAEEHAPRGAGVVRAGADVRTRRCPLCNSGAPGGGPVPPPGNPHLCVLQNSGQVSGGR